MKLPFKNYEELLEKANNLGIVVKEHEETGLVNLVYSQIDTPKQDEFGQKCRGLVIDKELNIICHPFKRFFNYGEMPQLYPNLKDIDHSLISYYEKVDGSLVKLYFYKDKWLVGTKGQVIANSVVNDNGFTFLKLILQSLQLDTLEELNHIIETELKLNKDLTYLFEVTSRFNSPVVPHDLPKLWFLASVDKTGKVIEVAQQKIFQGQLKDKIFYPRKYEFNNLEIAYKEAQNLPFNDEGYVIYINNQPCFKMKSPAYVATHLLASQNKSEKAVLNLVWSYEEAEFLNYFPNEKENFAPYIQAREAFIQEVLETYKKYEHIEDRKAFALSVKDYYFSSILFSFKNGKFPTELETLEQKLSYIIQEKMVENVRQNLLIEYMDKNGFERRVKL